MPIPKFPGHEKDRIQKIDEAKEIRKHIAEETDLSNDPSVTFVFGKRLGKGSFGSVYEAMNTATGEMVAIKQIEIRSDRAHRQIPETEKEIDLLKRLRHPNIVSIKGSLRTPKIFYVIMELVSGRSLSDVLKDIGPFHEMVIRKFTRQLLIALEYCHRNGCIHRDIKGLNILLTTNGQVKLCDFGSAKLREESIDKDAVSVTYSYTPLWVAPEVFTGAKMYNERVDIWSLGCVFIEMASGKDPWSEKNFQVAHQALFHIGTSSEIPLIPKTLSQRAQEFARLCLTRDPDRRPSAAELLKHPFIVGDEPQLDLTGSASTTFSLSNSAVAQLQQISNAVETAAAQAAAAAAAAAAATPLMPTDLPAVVDTKSRTMELGESTAIAGPSAALEEKRTQPTIKGQAAEPQQSISLALPATPASPKSPLPDVPPYPFARSDAPLAMQPVLTMGGPQAPAVASSSGANRLITTGFNMVYSFGTRRDDVGGDESEMDSSIGGGDDSRRMAPTPSDLSEGDSSSSSSNSRVYRFEASSNSIVMHDTNSAGPSCNSSLTSSVLSFVEGYEPIRFVPTPTIAIPTVEKVAAIGGVDKQTPTIANERVRDMQRQQFT